MKARSLDVVITKITKATVFYDLYIGGRSEEWRVPNASTFDLSTLEIGKRYEVWTKEIWSDEYNYRKGYNERMPRYEWVSVKEKDKKARSNTMSAKQAAFKKEADALPWADNGELFRGL